jgi:hypothetical protein
MWSGLVYARQVDEDIVRRPSSSGECQKLFYPIPCSVQGAFTPKSVNETLELEQEVEATRQGLRVGRQFHRHPASCTLQRFDQPEVPAKNARLIDQEADPLRCPDETRFALSRIGLYVDIKHLAIAFGTAGPPVTGR